MILVGNQRGGGQNLALHLMKDENERVQLHELRGFVADDLQGAFQESHAISRGTRCKQHLYSLSLSPPKGASVDDETFMDAVDRAEERLGLQGQPRAVVFHEKQGGDGALRRHAHAVWCRIDTEAMKAKQLSFDRPKLNALARELYLEHDWQMPRGFISKDERNPRNYSLAEWQQAKRAERDPDKLKRMFQDCWVISDGKAALAHALEERGYILARGDRRGFVALDHKGEVYSLSRWIGKKPKELKARLGSGDDLPSTKQAHEMAAKIVTDRLKELETQERAKAEREKTRIEEERKQAIARAQAKEAALRAAQEQRRQAEQVERSKRVRKGLGGLLDRLTGRRKKIEAQNSQEAAQALKRDQSEQRIVKEAAVQTLSRNDKREAFLKERAKTTLDELREDRRALKASFADMAGDGKKGCPKNKKADFRERRGRDSSCPKRRRSRNGPEPSL